MIRNFIFCIAFLGICFQAFPQAGSLDPDFLPNMKGARFISQYGISYTKSALQPDGKVLLEGTTGYVMRIDSTGEQDPSFQNNVQHQDLRGIRQLQSGRILLFGRDFNKFQQTLPKRSGIALLNPDGKLNMSFQNILINGSLITDAEIQNDGKILLAGTILLNDGDTLHRFSLLRLLPDGSIDPGFQRVVFDKKINAIQLLPNGKILAGGECTKADFQPTKPILLLNENGTRDPSFSTNFNETGVYRIIPCPNGRFLLVTPSYTIIQMEPSGLVNNSFQTIPSVSDRIHSPIELLTDGTILVGSGSVSFDESYVRKYSGNGAKDTSFRINLPERTYLKSILILPENRILITGSFRWIQNELRYQLALFSSSGHLLSGYSTLPKSVNYVNSVAVQDDQKIVIGGYFLSVWGKRQVYLARLMPDGELDTTFQSNIPIDGHPVSKVKIQSDGKILVLRDYGGASAGETEWRYYKLERYLKNGIRDNSFLSYFPPDWKHFNNIEIQPNGKILITGAFDSLFHKSRRGMIQLFPDGTIDESFQCQLPFDLIYITVSISATQADGKVLYGGFTSSMGQSPRDTLVRLLENGSIDPDFQRRFFKDGQIYGIKNHPDGSILVTGFFKSIDGFPGVHQGFARLSKNGDEVLSHFDFLSQGNSLNYVSDFFVQSDGKIILCGLFQFVSGDRFSLLRIHPDGSLDTSFPPAPLGSQIGGSLCMQPLKNRVLFACDAQTITGNGSTSLRGFSIGEFLPNNPCLISGSVTSSTGSNCESLPGSTPVPSQIIMADPGPYYGLTNDEGQYSIQTDTGSYQVSQILSVNSSFSSVRTQICPPDSLPISVHIANPGDSSGGHHFSDDVPECARLFLTIGADRRRRCARNQTVIMVHNIGNLASKPTKVFVKFPRYVSLISASQTFTFHPTDSTYSFELNPIAPHSWKNIQITDSVLCIPGITGIVQCTKAWLSSTTYCNPSPNWDGADLKVTGKCSGLNPRFTIKNNGATMSAPANYRLFADSILVASQSFLLGSNDSLQLIPEFNNPNITRLEVPQSAFHPYENFTFAELNCSNIPRIAVWFPSSTESPNEQTTCREIRDSYDPNDKQVSPKGQTEEGFVTAGKTFDYTIRFQNTGNDTAYKVVVRDYVDEDFDLSTFIAGASSHPYTVSVSGKGKAILDFTFNRIKLVDSATNPALSQGFVSFRIKPKTETPIGSRLFNVADIYFDQNDPIRTNHTLNTLYEPLVVEDNLDTIRTVLNTSDWNISVYPNPALDDLSVFSNKQSELELFTILGQRKDQYSLKTGRNTLNIAHLPKGIYFLQFSSGSGKQTKRLIRQ